MLNDIRRDIAAKKAGLDDANQDDTDDTGDDPEVVVDEQLPLGKTGKKKATATSVEGYEPNIAVHVSLFLGEGEYNASEE